MYIYIYIYLTQLGTVNNVQGESRKMGLKIHNVSAANGHGHSNFGHYFKNVLLGN